MRAFGKMAYLMEGRKGLAVGLGIQLYKTLVRPHLEYAVPFWACVRDADMKKLDRCQTQCLRRILGTKAHSSGDAIHVIANVVPVSLRIQELCIREFIRILRKPSNHTLQVQWAAL